MRFCCAIGSVRMILGAVALWLLPWGFVGVCIIVATTFEAPAGPVDTAVQGEDHIKAPSPEISDFWLAVRSSASDDTLKDRGAYAPGE